MLGQRQLETVVAYAAGGAWRLLQSINRQVPGGSFQPTWAAAPLSKSSQRSTPALGWPRTTDSLHTRATSSIKHGRGAVLSVDLTNRCKMMCDPCFMDANQVGYVHELTLDEVKRILDDALTIKPRRQLSVQFSGGEPTISPIFLDAV